MKVFDFCGRFKAKTESKNFKLFAARASLRQRFRFAEGFSGNRFFPDMPCTKRVYTYKKASIHWAAGQNEERPSSCR